MRLVLLSSVLLASATAWAAPSPRWDVLLGASAWGAENAAGTSAGVHDRDLIAALSAAFPGDTSGWCKVGGECWDEVRDVSCDRAATTCTATGVADAVDPEAPFALAATGARARRLIALLSARSLCTPTACTVGAIACFSDRHDEQSTAGAADAHTTFTCEIHRAPLP